MTQHQFALANMCELTLDREKQKRMEIDPDILDTHILAPEKIEFTSRCIESQRYNTKCQYKGTFKTKFTFDKDGRLITKTLSVDEIETSRLNYKYTENKKYPIEIIDSDGKTIAIERDSDDLPTKITDEKKELIRWMKRDGYVTVDYEPIITSIVTFPGLIKVYKDNIITKAKHYNRNNTSITDVICRRYEDENWNAVTDEVVKVGVISKLKNRTARHKNGYIVFKLFDDGRIEDTPMLTGKSYTYTKFDGGANWTSREICDHKSSWDISESCTEELRSIEYRSFPKK